MFHSNIYCLVVFLIYCLFAFTQLNSFGCIVEAALMVVLKDCWTLGTRKNTFVPIKYTSE